LSANVDIWSGLEKFKYHKADYLNITHDKETRSIRFEQLITAFYKYQNNRMHE
jgi:hypothetical protein